MIYLSQKMMEYISHKKKKELIKILVNKKMSIASTSTTSTKSRKSDPNRLRLDIYISRLLKQVHKDISIGLSAKNTLNLMIQNTVERILDVSQDLVQLSNRKTIGSREVQSGVIMILPGELAKHAVSEATRSLGIFGGAIAGTQGKPVSKSARASLVMPVARIGGFMKYKAGGYRQGAGGPVYMASVVEYLTAEILELAGNVARDGKRKTISSRHIFLAVKHDDDLQKLFENVQISNDVVPSIHSFFFPKTLTKKTVKKSKSPKKKSKSPKKKSKISIKKKTRKRKSK